MKIFDVFYSDKNKKAYLQDCQENKILISIDCKSRKHCNYIAMVLKNGGFNFYDKPRDDKQSKDK